MASTSSTSFPHVEVDQKGVAHIANSTMKVVELVMAQRLHGWSPEELHFQHPSLSLWHIHAALAYYWGHKSDLDADIERREQFAKAAR